MTRPQSLPALWAWALAEHSRAERAAPSRIHDRDGDREGWGRTHADVVRGLPFARGFVRYLDAPGETIQTPAVRALAKMHQPGRVQSLEYRIASLAVESGTDLELARVLLRANWPTFRDAATRGLALLWELTEQSLHGADPDECGTRVTAHTRRGRKPSGPAIASTADRPNR